MRKRGLLVGLTFSILVVAALAQAADIVNGGFETGNLSGWTSTGQTSVTSAGTDPRTNNNLSLVGVGTHSALVGDATAYGYAGSMSSSITQNFTRGTTYDHLYFAWAAVGLVPNNGVYHATDETPWFQILVKNLTDATTLFNQNYYTGNIGSITPGWYAGSNISGTNDEGIWYYRPWDTFDLDLTGIAATDELQVILTARDCTLSGHASYAYLDGFGSLKPDINTVPEPGTFALVALGLGGLIVARMRGRKQA